MIPITIDASEMQQNFNIPDKDIKVFIGNVISELSIEFLRYWDKEASVLSSSKIQYKNALYVDKLSDWVYEVGLKGWLPNAIEQGLDAFDEKEGFRKSSKIHETRDGGWYLTIPFRHAMAGAIGESEVFSGVMPSEVYKQALALGTSNKSLDVKTLPQQYQAPKTRPTVITKSQIFEAYTHKSSIYAGMKRQVDSTGRGNYFTFRRVSDNSDANSWVNTGIEARNFSSKAMEKMDLVATINTLADKYIEQLV